MVDLPNTMVDLPNTMVDLPNTMVYLPNTMVYLPNQSLAESTASPKSIALCEGRDKMTVPLMDLWCKGGIRTLAFLCLQAEMPVSSPAPRMRSQVRSRKPCIPCPCWPRPGACPRTAYTLYSNRYTGRQYGNIIVWQYSDIT